MSQLDSEKAHAPNLLPQQPRTKRPYVTPAVQQLHYMVDQHVSLAASCKTTGSATGPTSADCKTTNGPCAALGS